MGASESEQKPTGPFDRLSVCMAPAREPRGTTLGRSRSCAELSYLFIPIRSSGVACL
jgi:hypothetical protein